MTGSSPGTKILAGEPGGLSTLLRAALPTLPVINRLPGVRKVAAGDFVGLAYTRAGVEAARPGVEAYAAVCGFARKDAVPLTYPHLLAFPLHMAIMSDQGFPYAALGMVHFENTITAHRAIGVGEVLDVSTTVGPARAHAKGALLDFVTSVTTAGEVAWGSTSTYLRRGTPPAGEPAAGLAIDDAPSGGMAWRLPADLGRAYAAVSGDANPIHLYPWTAKALGFRRQIAHGMWTLARSVAAIENRLPDAVTVAAAFKKPVFLPGTVEFASTATETGLTFALTNPKDGSPHLLGRTTSG